MGSLQECVGIEGVVIRRYNTDRTGVLISEIEKELKEAKKNLSELEKERDSAMNQYLEARKLDGKDDPDTKDLYDMFERAVDQVSVAESRVSALTGKILFFRSRKDFVRISPRLFITFVLS